MRASVQRPFYDWVLHNQTVFTCPYDTAGGARFFPGYTVRHSLPETRKSQFVYLRPDLGTRIYRYHDQLAQLEERLDIKLQRWSNTTVLSSPPQSTPAVRDHIERWFAWDLKATTSEKAVWCPA
jgi:hypothetical protein